MFPWESAFSGVEVTPTFAETRDFEIHISGDIVHSIEQYMFIHNTSRNELVKFHELISKVADFYVSRSTIRYRQPLNYYDIDIVVPPDEYAFYVNNSVFTNAVAQMSMEFAHEISLKLNLNPKPEWLEYSKKLYFPFDSKRVGYLEFEGFKDRIIKQADVILLGYPLLWKEVLNNKTIRVNDLNYYEPLTDKIFGPAMSWGMYSIGYLENQEFEKAHKLFERSYNNTHPPFLVWTEIPARGGVNFITGAGGFLQAILNGYCGLRILKNSHQWNPLLMKNTSKVKVKSVFYFDKIYSLEYDENYLIIELIKGNGLILISNNIKYTLINGTPLQIKRNSFIINYN